MPFHKVVFDTNVLISAFVFEGKSAKAIEYCIEHSEIYISNWILQELKEKLQYKLKLKETEIREIEKLIQSEFILRTPFGRMPEICRDKDDNNILWLAENANADFLVTGDKDLLVLKNYKNTQIISPAKYIEIVTL